MCKKIYNIKRPKYCGLSIWSEAANRLTICFFFFKDKLRMDKPKQENKKKETKYTGKKLLEEK